MSRGLLRISLSLAVPLTANVIRAAPSAAQLRVEFTPFAALYAPTRSVPPGALSPAQLGAPSYRQKIGPSIGGRLTEVLRQGTALDVSLAYAWSNVEYSTGDQHTSVRLWSVRLLVDLGSHRPRVSSLYALIGGAVTVHQGAEYSISQEYRPISAGVVAGLGLRRRMGRSVQLHTELEDYVYPLRGRGTRLQNDVLISVGPSFVVETF